MSYSLDPDQPDDSSCQSGSKLFAKLGYQQTTLVDKELKMVPVATLLDAQHYKATYGFSSLTNIAQLKLQNN